VTWGYQEKSQPEATRFKVPPVDAPNVNGARIFGFVPGEVGSEAGRPDTLALRKSVESGQVAALYVFDPGPDRSMGDTSWILDARRRGLLPLLVVHGVVMSDLARSADFILPGASYVEKEASYSNGQGRLQSTARVIPPPGDALEDWQILVNVGAALGAALDYTSAADLRADILTRFAGVPALDGLTSLAFGAAVPARNWLDASNPSERWKWDFMYQDLPPVKGAVDPTALPLPPGAIALKELK
jgi:anaerobic selenocysteine-containing dehydrogenase